MHARLKTKLGFVAVLMAILGWTGCVKALPSSDPVTRGLSITQTITPALLPIPAAFTHLQPRNAGRIRDLTQADVMSLAEKGLASNIRKMSVNDMPVRRITGWRTGKIPEFE